MKKLGFKNSLVLSVSLLIVVCLLGSNIYSYKTLKNRVIEDVDQIAIAAATSEAVKLQDWFATKFKAVDSLAKHYKPGSDAQQYVELTKFSKDTSDLTTVLIALDDGRSFSTISGPSWKDGVAIIDKYDARQSPWYMQGKRANREIDLTEVYNDAFSGKPLVSIVKAINGGVVLGGIDISIIDDSINAFKYPGAITGILDENGRALATNATDWPLGSTFAELGVPEIGVQMNAAKSNRFDFSFGDFNKVAYTHEIEMVSGKKWHLFVGVDKAVAYKAADDAFVEALISSAIMLLISVTVCILVLSKLYSPVILLKEMVVDLSNGDGDLTRRLPVSGKDDLADISQGINTFIENLQSMMLKVSGASEVIAGSTKQLDMLTSSSSSVLDEHRKETELVVTALDEMNATSRDVATNTAEAAKHSGQTIEHLSESRELMTQATYQVNQLVDEVDTTSSNIAQLGSDMTEITNVLTVIGEIADQTNLLALNAAIEAARAGEQGRGFAVVADEVRALASRTQASTSEIEVTLEKLKAGVKSAIISMDSTKTSCEETSQKNTNIANDMENITKSIQDSNEFNIQNAAAAEQQSSVTDEITQNMSSINEMVEQLSSISGDTNREKESLVKANAQLNSIVLQFKLK
ncbi:methyl-accepting chemotaxis protein [Vibrio sp. JC009]|uniref:methyl-accepting chemotaxis protein n=1 Tax=Vibrio sp. JC009 TaxID=2912314 RepID=UPI0023AEEED1|nr:methyl-accepting chemotaxis protein [Vibrio sp. JC009]WED24497.1 methyl-accepting chemotaxis protein [Vibrio sp. JC009]